MAFSLRACTNSPPTLTLLSTTWAAVTTWGKRLVLLISAQAQHVRPHVQCPTGEQDAHHRPGRARAERSHSQAPGRGRVAHPAGRTDSDVAERADGVPAGTGGMRLMQQEQQQREATTTGSGTPTGQSAILWQECKDGKMNGEMKKCLIKVGSQHPLLERQGRENCPVYSTNHRKKLLCNMLNLSCFFYAACG